MKGKILDFQVQSSSGAISGDDGKRYNFQASEWKADDPPERGMSVDFDIKNDQAVAIYLSIEGTNPVQKRKSKIIAGILAFIFGSGGFHKFYLGYTRTGLIYLAISLTGILLAYVPSTIMGIIALIEGIIYLCKSDEDFQRIYVIGKKQMF